MGLGGLGLRTVLKIGGSTIGVLGTYPLPARPCCPYAVVVDNRAHYRSESGEGLCVVVWHLPRRWSLACKARPHENRGLKPKIRADDQLLLAVDCCLE